MLVHIHQTHFQIADFKSSFNYLKKIISEAKPGIHVFPELFLTGYPLHDLCLQKSFIQNYHKLLELIRNKLVNEVSSQTVFLFGGISYKLTKNDIADKIENIIFQLDSSGLTPVYTKQLLPNYDIFDEQKYFSKGDRSKVIDFQNKKIGLLICEDMWASSFHKIDPVKNLQSHCSKHSIKLDAIVNLSASPWYVDKHDKRIFKSKNISRKFKCPFIYVNRVGGEDEIQFDGRSFVTDGESTLCELKMFQADRASFDLNTTSLSFKGGMNLDEDLTWEDLFKSRIKIDQITKPPKLITWSSKQCSDVLEALKFGFQEYATKTKFNKFTIALSGGIDSALVLAIIKLSLTQNQSVEAIYMPTKHSSSLSGELSKKLCQNLDIPFTELNIQDFYDLGCAKFNNTFSEEFSGVADENIQSRIRGLLIYGRSNQVSSMVVNTSNKSELAVGYSTQYGDSVGAISLLGDLYKSEVYILSKYINKNHNNIIPPQIITREPTAELKQGQIDSDSLPTYDVLDAILDGILSYRFSTQNLVELGFKQSDVEKVMSLYLRSEFKRSQFSPIIKISPKSFGFGYRVPITKSSSYYNSFI